MRRGLAIAALLGGCNGSDPINPIDAIVVPDGRPPFKLPDGVWEPMPGAPITGASLAVENGTVWWALKWFNRSGTTDKFDLWLGATSSAGTSIVAPTLVTSLTTPSNASPHLVITPTAIMAMLASRTTLVRRYDRAGTPLGDAYPIVIENGGTPITVFADTELVPTADGRAQFVASLYNNVSETAILDLDASGTPTATVLLGTPDTCESTRSVTVEVAAAALPDGSTLIAWDRQYSEPFIGPVCPSATLTRTISGTTVGATQAVHDLPDVYESAPAIASSGANAYITWRSFAQTRSRIALAKFPDVTTVIAEIDHPNSHPYDAAPLALGEPGRGAIMYRTQELDVERLHVVAFAESSGTVQLSTPRVLPQIDPDAFGPRAIGLVHMGGDRYLVAWGERAKEPRLYAMEIEFSDAMMRPAPAFDTPTKAAHQSSSSSHCGAGKVHEPPWSGCSD